MAGIFCHIKSKKGVINLGGYDERVFYSRNYAKKSFTKAEKIFIVIKLS